VTTFFYYTMDDAPMLDGFRRIGQSIVGRIITTLMFGMLIFSFGIWGIGDMIRNFNANALAKIGTQEISVPEFKAAYQNEIQSISQRIRRNLTSQEALNFGLDRRVLDRMINEKILDQYIAEWKLEFGQDTIAKAILTDPNFAGADGKFSRALFDEALRQSGYTEDGFLSAQRIVYLRGQIAEAVAGGMSAPPAATALLHRYRQEQRTVTVMTIKADPASAIAPVDEAQLTAFFNERKAAFNAPEYRGFTFVALRPTDVAPTVPASEEEARSVYEKTKTTRFQSPETRGVRQLVLTDQDKSAKAEAALKEGKSFQDIAALVGINEQETNLGVISKDAIADPAVQQAVFGTSATGMIGPIDGRFGKVLAEVTVINASVETPFASVVSGLRQELSLQKAREKIRELREQIEDQRASAKPLTAIASELGLKAVKVEQSDATGLDPKGALLDTIAEPQTLLPAIFSNEMNADTDALTLRDGGLIWFAVESINPSRDRTFEEAKDAVKAAWLDDERSRLVAQKASDLVRAINGGKKISDQAQGLNLPVKGLAGLTRQTPAKDVPAPVLSQIFLTPVGQAASALGDASDERVIFVVESAVLPKLDETAAKTLNNEVALSLSDDVISQLISDTRNRIGVTISEVALQAATGKTN
jgi:peptidyl-prolyl cis-trans isomerase D